MALDIAALVAPLSDEAPSGPDLAYDDERGELERVFEKPADYDASSDTEEIDWRGTIAMVTAQAERTRDLWLPIYLMRAAAQLGQLDMVSEGADLLAALLEERWADVHPQLDEYGFIGRKTPCESLTRLGDFLNPLGRLTLIAHSRLGSYSGADFIRFQDQGANAENYGMFRALIEATPPEELQAVVDKIDGLRAAIRRSDSVLTDNSDGETSTNFQPTYDAIERIRRAVASMLPVGADSAAAEAPTGDAYASPSQSTGTSAPSGGGAGFSGGISSRDDVIRALDAICKYYASYEPTSPVPFALRRAREWISLDFMAVLEDIAPGSVDEAQRVLKGARAGSSVASGGDYSAPEPSPATSSSDDGW